MRSVLTAQGEAAQGLIRAAVGALRLELRCDSLTGRLRRVRLVAGSVPSHRSYIFQSAAVRVVSIAEEYSRSSLINAVEARLPPANRLVARFWERVSADAESTWPQQAQAWNQWFEVNVQGSDAYKELQPYIDARNAIAHGLGSLTRKQLGGDGGAAVRKRLADAGIFVEGIRIVLDEVSVVEGSQRAAEYVGWLDERFQALPVHL